MLLTLRPSAYLILAIMVAFLAGCGPARVKVKGRLLNDGQPLERGNQEILQVIFIPYTESGPFPDHVYTANVYRDGTLEVPGDEGKGIPPGKYRISVGILVGASERDRLEGKFGREKSPIIRDVTGQEVIIDISKPTG